MRTIVLCGRPNSCCPEVHINDEKTDVNITDDYGNVVYMKFDEFRILQKAEV